MAEAKYTVTGMTCSHCEKSVTEEVSALPGVSGVEVSAEQGTLIVRSELPLEDSAVLDAVEEAGYEASRA